MALQMVVARANVNKSDFILQEIRKALQTAPNGQPIFYIVPEQMTFQQEFNLFQNNDIKGSTRAQVVSLSRLAWRILQETGGATKQFISSTGTQMMLRKIIAGRVDGWRFFQKSADKHGFIKELDQMITEFKRHQITPELLQEHLHYTKENIPLQNKLMDLLYVYEELLHLFADKYIDGEDQLTLLTEKIYKTDFFHGSTIYIDGFHHFSPNELQIVGALLQTADDVTIGLTLDEKNLSDEMTELDLFYKTQATYNKLIGLAHEYHVTVKEPIVAGAAFRRLSDPFIAHVEKHFDERPAPVLNIQTACPIHIKEAVHPRAELEGVIQEILRLTREGQYRYRDMVIYIRDQEEYNDLIQTMFNDYDIPIFIDEKRTMLNHPFIEFIRSLFDVVESNWRYDAVFRLLKTGFIKPTNKEYPLTVDAIDQLENYVLEYGVKRRADWLQEGSWRYQRFRGFTTAAQTDRERKMEKKINSYRQQVVHALKDFDEQIRQEKTIVGKCESLYRLMEFVHVPKQLESNMHGYEDMGLQEKAREEEQVWDGFIQLLDEVVEMIGEEKLSFSLFKQTVEAGLEALEFSHIPPSMDHIIIASIDHSRIAGKKCSFLLGVNEGAWPMKPPLDGLINEREREFLKQFGLELAASSRRVLLDDMFYMYLAFTTATDYMWISYCLGDNDGGKKMASQMIHRMAEFFPVLQQPELLQDPDELANADRFITTPEKTRSALTAQLARSLRGYPLAPVWQDVLLWYIKNEKQHGTTNQVLQSLFYENKPVNLHRDTVKELYQKQIKTSVSRLEMLYRCSYQHFVAYDLRLENRRTFKLDAPDIGQLFHEAIKVITEWMQQDGRDFAQMTKADSTTLAAKSMHHLAPALNHHILASSNRYKYIKRKLQDVIAKATYMLSEQARLTGFSPVGIELGFGLGKGLEPLRVSLPNGYELLLRGRIDRVDRSQGQDGLYLRIIDYKSSSRGLNLADVYYGLALQMITYLHVVLMQAQKWLGTAATPAGMLYYHVHDAMLSENDRLKEDVIQRKIFQKYKMSGLLLADEEITKAMDTSLESGHSDIIPVGLKKTGGFYANSSIASKGTFDLLQQHIRELIVDAGFHITSGKIALNPYENAAGNACAMCEFKSICQFDPTLKENNFRRLPALKEREALEMISNKLTGKGGMVDGEVDGKTTGGN